jgi:hypothetical protein
MTSAASGLTLNVFGSGFRESAEGLQRRQRFFMGENVRVFGLGDHLLALVTK